MIVSTYLFVGTSIYRVPNKNKNINQTKLKQLIGLKSVLHYTIGCVIKPILGYKKRDAINRRPYEINRVKNGILIIQKIHATTFHIVVCFC